MSPANILVVDDEPQLERLVRQRLRKQVREGKYQFSFAGNGQEALEMIDKSDDIQIVLTDINMPIMDGLTLITRIRDQYPRIKSVIVSAYGDMRNIRKAMNYGAFDFLIKPIEFTDLETTIAKTMKEVLIGQEAEKAQMLEARNNSLEELDAMKTRFFTNISHEFRTPLTVIGGMTSQIEEEPEKWLGRGLSMIKRNTAGLLSLINQILELRKLDARKMPLNYKQGDFVSYLGEIIDHFHSYAESRDIQLRYVTNDLSSLSFYFDQEKIRRIFSNLIGNAIKFTAAGGQIDITVSKSDEDLEIAVADTGKGISEQDLPHIFNRFYQADNSERSGTGIGLSLVKELIDLLNGNIRVSINDHGGTTFLIKLPIVMENQAVDEPDHIGENVDFELMNSVELSLTSDLEMVDHQEDVELSTLLLVEDNADVRSYLVSILEGRYQLQLAVNGEDGVRRAIEEVPDLIISDVMMPVMDGFELCETLKKDPLTDHIPIILLTAKADDQSRIAGLEYGADAYLAKPFDRRELLVRIDKLLEIRSRLRARYLKHEDNEEVISGNPGDRFIKLLKETIERNIDDEAFGIIEICRALGKGRTQLHRKIKAVTGMSTSIYVRSVRLNQARRLLETTDRNISEVAYDVGFKDPKYFSRVFTEMFGAPPTKLRT